MNRRTFFKTVGISALALPFVKFIKDPELEFIDNWPLDTQGIERAWAYPWDTFIVVCPHCKQAILVPYISGGKNVVSHHLKFICTNCQNQFNRIVSLKTGQLKAYWHENKVFF